MTPGQETDLHHLVDLLELLPSDAQSDDWERINAAVSAARDGYGADSYISRKLLSARDTLQGVLTKPDSELIRWSVSYVLLFDVDDDLELAKVIGNIVLDANWGDANTGRRWIADACETAWRLYVSTAALRLRQHSSAE